MGNGNGSAEEPLLAEKKSKQIQHPLVQAAKRLGIRYDGIVPTFSSEGDTSPEALTNKQKAYLYWNTFLAKLEGLYRKLLQNGFPVTMAVFTIAYLLSLSQSALFMPEQIELRAQDTVGSAMYILTVREIFLAPFLNSLLGMFGMGIIKQSFRLNLSPTVSNAFCGFVPGQSEEKTGAFLYTGLNEGLSGILTSSPMTCGNGTIWSINTTAAIPKSVIDALGSASPAEIMQLRLFVLAILPALTSIAVHFAKPIVGQALQKLGDAVITLARMALYYFPAMIQMTGNATWYLLKKLCLTPLYHLLALNRPLKDRLDAAHHAIQAAHKTCLTLWQTLPPIYDRTFVMNHGGSVTVPGLASSFSENVGVLQAMPGGEALAATVLQLATDMNAKAKAGKLDEQTLFAPLHGSMILTQIQAASDTLTGESNADTPAPELTPLFNTVQAILQNLVQQALLNGTPEDQAKRLAEVAALEQQLIVTLKSLFKNRVKRLAVKHFAHLDPNKLDVDYLKKAWPVLYLLIAEQDPAGLDILSAALGLERSKIREGFDSSWLGRYLGTMPGWLKTLRKIRNDVSAEALDHAQKTHQQSLAWLYLDSDQCALLPKACEGILVADDSSARESASGGPKNTLKKRTSSLSKAGNSSSPKGEAAYPAKDVADNPGHIIVNLNGPTVTADEHGAENLPDVNTHQTADRTIISNIQPPVSTVTILHKIQPPASAASEIAPAGPACQPAQPALPTRKFSKRFNDTLPDTGLRFVCDPNVVSAARYFYDKQATDNSLLGIALAESRVDLTKAKPAGDSIENALADLASLQDQNIGAHNRNLWIITLRLIHLTQGIQKAETDGMKETLTKYHAESDAREQQNTLEEIKARQPNLIGLLMRTNLDPNTRENATLALESIFARQYRAFRFR